MVSTNVVNKDSAIKYDKNKVRMDLLPPYALTEVAKTYTYGSMKYSDNNWQKGLEWSRIYAAALRHLFAYWQGEDRDKGSELYHLAHAVYNCLTLLEYYNTHPELDDRMYKRGVNDETDSGE